MKRPAGPGKPAVPEPEPVSAPVTPVTRRTRGTVRSRSLDATTEPIVISTIAAAASVSSVAEAREPRETLDEITPPAPSTLTPSAARTQLRAAKRNRRRYERDEVRRFTWRSRRRKRTWLVLGSALAGLIAFVVIGAYSPLMALRTIDVIGTSRIPAEQVQKALAGQLGTPLPIVDVARIKRELASFTLIQSYVTESHPPNTLVVRIVEREPVGLVQTEGGFDLVDAAGVVVASSGERPAGFPIILAANGPGHAGFTAAAAVVRSLPEEVRARVDTVTAATTDDVTLTLAEGSRVVWGSAERSEYKAVVLAALMVSYPPGTVNEYDVTSPDSAVLR
ncbi:cell division protein FtsQ/DivIB [Glaciibacter psychrotolerans]|uniref:Cell division protein FtsQ n=1 Tax=Glaciibacter psychrotolerans TaxID=670054 RepID=A0A7Z0EBX7_9MICO|nr:FtsQ-type POTRA domain-containing protein [Leifsonia psychrotolerans]NYJ18821.1 cell division protein FtsQ [Leifsonia psychrotolerans]